MSTERLEVTERTRFLVNRTEEMAKIYDAIYRSPAHCQIIFIAGKGGMGKTRLVEEVLWRGGNSQMRLQRSEAGGPSDWSSHTGLDGQPAVFGSLIDLADVRLHSRTQLMRAIRDALLGEGAVDFRDYDVAYSRYRSLRERQTEYAIIHSASEEAERYFIKDFNENEARGRQVLILDTAERLRFTGSEDMLKSGLITHSDLTSNSTQWLVDLIQRDAFHNTTLILVGRDEEGQLFFDTIRDAICTSEGNCSLEEIPMEPFTPEDARQYFQYLSEDWEQKPVEPALRRKVTQALKALAGNEDRCKVLWLYTAGQPVRLALYADLIIEGRSIPARLKDSWEQATRAVGTEDPIQQWTQELADAQNSIESEFISLLFRHPDLRTRILQALVRTPRGLTKDQLLFIIFAPQDADPQGWQPDQKHREEIGKEIKNLLSLAIVKSRPDERIALQDEIYRIYSRHMAADPQNQQDERQARQDLYQKLDRWADRWLNHYSARRKDFQTQDERKLRFETPARALSVQFPILTNREQEHRANTFELIRSWELEKLHYQLLLNLRDTFNNAYFDLAENGWIAEDEESDAMAQAELWQVLKDENLRPFLTVHTWPAVKARGEDPLDALLRVAEQFEATQWIKRFVLRKNYTRAIQFYTDLEGNIDAWEESVEKRSWQHTFAAGERRGWYCYARILCGEDSSTAIADLEATLEQLVKLSMFDQDTMAVSERHERGMIGHPGENRLKRVIAVMYNNAGYGYAVQGRSRQAVRYYGIALRYMRGTRNRAQQGITRNNLSRGLSDLGREYARQVCLDGLQLRKQIGAEVPIAYSMNTLALIDNDFFRPTQAWVEAATAVAYFRRADDPRGLGLALLQLGEALRRMAGTERTGLTLSDPPEVILQEAEDALLQAVGLFTERVHEPSRLAEAYIELGCVQRDHINIMVEEEEKRRRHRDAIDSLKNASDLAQSIHLKRLEIDARINNAWTHYYYQDLDLAEKTLQDLETDPNLFPEDCLILRNGSLPQPGRDDAYLYQQLSKSCSLRARIEMDRFQERLQAIEEENPQITRENRHQLVHMDKKAQKLLVDAAQYFTLSAAYASLFSTQSGTVRIVHEIAYEYLKKFNLTEMDDFFKYMSKARRQFHINQIKMEDTSKLETFLSECFGDSAR